MSLDYDAIEVRMRRTVCPTCVRYTREGRCSLPADRECSLFHALPQVVSIVRSTNDPSIAPYVDKLRATVCSACQFDDGHAYCPKREALDCALDSYFPLIVDVIEQELAEQRRRPSRRESRQ